MNALRNYSDRWQSTKIDSLSISLATRLRNSCKPDEKIVFHNDIPMIIPKTKFDLFIDSLKETLCPMPGKNTLKM